VPGRPKEIVAQRFSSTASMAPAPAACERCVMVDARRRSGNFFRFRAKSPASFLASRAKAFARWALIAAADDGVAGSPGLVPCSVIEAF
jgi:hypothetical protein